MFKNFICWLCAVAVFSGCDVSAMKGRHMGYDANAVIDRNLGGFFYASKHADAVGSLASALVDIAVVRPQYALPLNIIASSLSTIRCYTAGYDGNKKKFIKTHVHGRNACNACRGSLPDNGIVFGSANFAVKISFNLCNSILYMIGPNCVISVVKGTYDGDCIYKHIGCYYPLLKCKVTESSDAENSSEFDSFLFVDFLTRGVNLNRTLTWKNSYSLPPLSCY